MLDEDGNLRATDGFLIGYKGGYYFRKPDNSGTLSDKNGMYLLKDDILYEETPGGYSKIEKKK